MPTLTFTEGDTAVIYAYNQLKEETSLHWHGIILSNQYNGVPWMTQRPIKEGDARYTLSQLFKTELIGITVILMCRSKVVCTGHWF